ncbi:hypothetical protein ACFPU1_07040 [Thalassorhabdus alkalitolerans]|uniref:Uncharacterized protein n=1 Tax=Thalassorhabdus alkalitolerans TaxID=2282697 RepID=A0ABW0YM86_9BACI
MKEPACKEQVLFLLFYEECLEEVKRQQPIYSLRAGQVHRWIDVRESANQKKNKKIVKIQLN